MDATRQPPPAPPSHRGCIALGMQLLLGLVSVFAVTLSAVTANSNNNKNITNNNVPNKNNYNHPNNSNNNSSDPDNNATAANLLNSTQTSATAIVGAFPVPLESLWDTKALIQQAGFVQQTHTLTSADGYFLSLQRLPQPGHQPVLLLHGLYGSSLDFVALGDNASLAFLLWRDGFDVWLANCRGSAGHAHHSREKAIFWNFSFHQIGLYDLPALIDYVRTNSSFHQVHLLGHSQGGTAGLVLLSEKPSYQKKVGMVQLLAPLVYFHHARLAADTVQLLRAFLDDEGSRDTREFLPKGTLERFGCTRHRFMELLCWHIVGQFTGLRDALLVDERRARLFFNQFPAGGSVKQLRHFYQLYAVACAPAHGGVKTADLFRQYDYGREGNFDLYGSAVPPSYNLSRIRVPIVLHYGENDALAAPSDILLLKRQLPKVIRSRMVPHAGFQHLDFVWAKDVAELLNKDVVRNFIDFN